MDDACITGRARRPGGRGYDGFEGDAVRHRPGQTERVDLQLKWAGAAVPRPDGHALSSPASGVPVDSSNDVLALVDVTSGVRQYSPSPALVTEAHPTRPSE